MIARSLEAYSSMHDDVLAVAAGVSASRTSDPDAYARELGLLQREVLRASTEGLLLVYFSGGGAIYGTTPVPASEGQRLRPQSRYGQHQVVCERTVRESGVRYMIVRLPNVVGTTGNVRQLVPNLVSQVLAGRVLVQSRATRDLIDAEDMAQVLIELLDTGPARLTVNVASGHSVPVPEIVRSIATELGASPEVLSVDVGEPQQFDVSRMRELIGRDPFSGRSYLGDVLAKYVPGIAAALSGTPSARAGDHS